MLHNLLYIRAYPNLTFFGIALASLEIIARYQEGVRLRHSKTLHASVIAIPDSLWGESVRAFGVLKTADLSSGPDLKIKSTGQPHFQEGVLTVGILIR